MAKMDQNQPDDTYVGTVELDDEGNVIVPEEIAEATQYVVRTPWNTTVNQGLAFTYYGSENDHLEEGEISFKLWGEEERVYRVKNYSGDGDGQ